MARYSYYLVISVLSLVLVGCFMDVEIPRDIYIEDDFSMEEQEVLLQAIEEWNDVSLRCTGKMAINYIGLHDDPNGFDENDFGDSRHLIYLLSQDSDIYQEILEDFYGHGYSEEFHPIGYGTPADVILFPDPNYTLEDIRVLALHELGHFLGIQHNQISPDEMFGEGSDSVMFHHGNYPHLTEIDIKAFCIIHDCPNCSF